MSMLYGSFSFATMLVIAIRSTSSSSMSKMEMVSFMVGQTSLRRFAGHPVVLDGAHHFDELRKFHRLDHVAGHAVAEACNPVCLIARSRQDDHRDGLERRILLHDGEELDAVHARHVQVEEDE